MKRSLRSNFAARNALRERLPFRREALLLFGVCSVLVHAWAFVMLLRELPAWLLRLSVSELVRVVAYTLSFALFESVLVWSLLLVAAVVLPAKLFRERLVGIGVAITLLTTAWAMAAHYQTEGSDPTLGYATVRARGRTVSGVAAARVADGPAAEASPRLAVRGGRAIGGPILGLRHARCARRRHGLDAQSVRGRDLVSICEQA